MPPPIPVVLSAPCPEWPRLAGDLAARLKELCGLIAEVQHIGSTAVPGLAAKPVIDLMPLVPCLEELDSQRTLIESSGWAWHGELGMSGRRYCTLSDAAGVRIAQAHFFEAASAHAARHLAFRDYLCAHPSERLAYESEKRRAQALHPENSHAYSDEKAAWIRAAEARALAWSAAR